MLRLRLLDGLTILSPVRLKEEVVVDQKVVVVHLAEQMGMDLMMV
jgi:hypothetical protein